MSKESAFKMDGEIIEVLPNATFKIKLFENQLIVLAYVSGKMRKHEIRILMGDTVSVEMSPYDLSRGRIVRRN